MWRRPHCRTTAAATPVTAVAAIAVVATVDAVAAVDVMAAVATATTAAATAVASGAMHRMAMPHHHGVRCVPALVLAARVPTTCSGEWRRPWRRNNWWQQRRWWCRRRTAGSAVVEPTDVKVGTVVITVHRNARQLSSY